MRREHGRRCGCMAVRAACARAVGASSLSLGVVAALLAIPLGHLVLQRGSVVHGVRVAGVPLGGASRAQAEREISAAVGDELQREVTVTVAGRSATLSPYDLGVRVDAARTATRRARRRQGARRAALLARLLALDRARAALSGSPRAAGRARERDAGARQRAPRAQAERRRDRDPRQGRASASIPPRRCARSRAPRSQIATGVSLRTVPDAGRDLDRGGAPRQGPRRAAAVGADRVHAPRAGRRPLARAPARAAAHAPRPTST